LFLDSSAVFPEDFLCHKTQEKVTGTMALFGDMLTLWMRRTKDPYDVLCWLKEERIV
jgi:hypothetical protein